MEQRYKTLRIIAFMMKLSGFILAGLTVLAALAICGTAILGGAALDRFGREFGQGATGLGILSGVVGGIIGMILPIVLGGGLAMVLFAAGEAINLQIDIEENTRAMVYHLRSRSGVPSAIPATIHPSYATQSYTPDPSASVQPVSSTGSSPPNQIKEFCPQCGTKVESTDTSCPECNYALS